VQRWRLTSRQFEVRSRLFAPTIQRVFPFSSGRPEHTKARLRQTLDVAQFAPIDSRLSPRGKTIMKSPTAKRSLVIILTAGLILAAGCGPRAVTKVASSAPQVAESSDATPPATLEMQADVKDLAVGEELEVPYILWGGDVAMFLANGGETTQPGSIFAKHGLKLKLVRGDDFGQQVKNYKEGKTAFLRGTMSMLGQASGEIAGDPRSQPVVFMQLTWSAGDHLVARQGCSTLADLKGKKIALQKGGPHVGMLSDILHTAQFTWSDVQVVWTDDVTGDKGPAELFRKDPTVDACFAITPDMLALTGGLKSASWMT